MGTMRDTLVLLANCPLICQLHSVSVLSLWGIEGSGLRLSSEF